MKARLNNQHEYMTLRVEDPATKHTINLTLSYSGTKVSWRGVDQPLAKQMFKTFTRIMEAKGAKNMTRFEGLMTLAEEALSMEELAKLMDGYTVPPAEPKEVEELMETPEEAKDKALEPVREVYRQPAEQHDISDRFMVMHQGSSTLIIDKNDGTQFDCPLFALAEVKKALLTFCS